MNRVEMLKKVESIVDKKPMAWCCQMVHGTGANYYFVRKNYPGEDYLWISQSHRDLNDLGIGNCQNLSIRLKPGESDYVLCDAAIKIFDAQIQKEINAFYRFVYNEKNHLKYTVDYDTEREECMLSLNQQPKYILKQKDGKLYLNRPRGITTHAYNVEVPMPFSVVLQRAAIPSCSK